MMGFEIVDFFWGCPPGFFSIFVLVGAFLVVPFVLMSMSGLFMAPGRVEGAVEGLWRRFYGYLGVEHGLLNSYGGFSHFSFTLFLMIFMMNFLGCVAYFPALAVHWKMWISISIPCWMASLMYTWPENLRMFFANMVSPDQPYYLTALLIVSEIMSLLARPVTLALRVWVNMLIGQLFLHFLASGLVVAFFSSFSVGAGFGVFMYAFLGFGMTLAEMCVVVIQSVIFVKLVLIYSSEGVFDSEAVKAKSGGH
uniref:ATP synthase F0 subunit 6 n=1 Tax=Lithoredo abatanica TaxID=2586797 RepID=UPI002028A811|nr:ATP synthase F0 subunit 6 [Lithoredo abatanica]UPX89236.1 ATP synthase F0 subunit 6 [Lithoredo abatanica]UPX89248.1 ATP synthase F0 subunit 6 [Lithoredo abatanica]